MNQFSFLAVSADAWLVSLVETSLRLSLVLLVASAIVIALRRSSANLRHLVWAVALAGALILPVAASYLPVVNLPMPGPLHALAGVWDDAVTVGSSDTPRAIPAVVTGGDLDSIPDIRDDDGLSAVVLPRGVPVVSGRGPQPVTATASPGTGVHQPAALHPVVPPLGWSQLLAGLWFAGIVVLLLRVGLGLVATGRLGRRAARPRDGEWQRLAAELSRRIGLTRPVRVLCSNRAVVPMTWGWFRPVVLVPEAGAAWSAARKRVVLLHELNHVKRHDCASQLIAHVACAVYWFNPLVWLAARALRIERERACDEAVVRDGTQASSYADHLLEIARAHRDTGWSSLAAVAMARRSQLEGRLLSILDADQRRRPSRRTPLVLATVMGAVILVLTAVTPTMRADSPAEAEAATTVGVSVAQQAPASPSQTSASDDDEVEARRVAVQEQAEVQALQRQLADDQARLELELERQTLALAAVAQDSAQREQVEVEVRELERRLEQVRDRVERDVHIDVERIVELAQQAAERALVIVGRDVDGLRFDQEEIERVVERARRAADRALAGVDFELNFNGIQRRGRDARRPLDPRVIELFIESLSDDAAEVREQAARGLGRNRVEAGVDALSNALRDEDPEVREAAAWALGMIRSDAAIGPLSGLLDDGEPDVAEQAAWALGMIRSDTAVSPLVGALDAAEPDVREQAAWALGMIRSPSAVPGLAAALDDSELKVRTEVVEALGRIRDATAVDPLVGALGDSEPRVRREAAEALGRIRDPRAVDGLVAALGDAEPAVVKHAVEALGMIRDARAVSGLVSALQHQDPDVVEEAAEALGRIRSDAAVDGLIAALGDAEGEAAEEIVEALGRIGGDRALDALIEMTGDASPAVRKAVIEALSGRRWPGNADPNPDPNSNPNPNPNP